MHSGDRLPSDDEVLTAFLLVIPDPLGREAFRTGWEQARDYRPAPARPSLLRRLLRAPRALRP